MACRQVVPAENGQCHGPQGPSVVNVEIENLPLYTNFAGVREGADLVTPNEACHD